MRRLARVAVTLAVLAAGYVGYGHGFKLVAAWIGRPGKPPLPFAISMAQFRM